MNAARFWHYLCARWVGAISICILRDLLQETDGRQKNEGNQR